MSSNPFNNPYPNPGLGPVDPISGRLGKADFAGRGVVPGAADPGGRGFGVADGVGGGMRTPIHVPTPTATVSDALGTKFSFRNPQKSKSYMREIFKQNSIRMNGEGSFLLTPDQTHPNFLVQQSDFELAQVQFKAKRGDWGRTSFEKAAADGETKAFVFLGEIYLEGFGIPKDYPAALRWFIKAADAGDAKGQAFIGWIYEKGFGVTKDEADAVKWYFKAARNKSKWAAESLKRLISSVQPHPSVVGDIDLFTLKF